MSQSLRDGMTVADGRRDPETQEIVRDSYRLIVRSEKLLTQLEDHLDLLRTFVRTHGDETEETPHEQ